MYKEFVDFVRSVYPDKQNVGLHEPTFMGREKEYLCDTIDSTFVSSVGEYVNRFERMICEATGAKYAIATVNGTLALHTALKLAKVTPGDEVITQSLTFIATANAIHYCGANPVFIDVDLDTMGLSPKALEIFLERYTVLKDGRCVNRETGRTIRACVPMHTFGHPCRIDEIKNICENYHLCLVEDSAESLGSRYKETHTGLFGRLGIFSFNGNKIITTGGGGMIITNDELIAERAKHITTTAKKNHPYRYEHDIVGFNYRLPNLNAALGCAQMENLDYFVKRKRELADEYETFFRSINVKFFREPDDSFSNYWLNAVILNSTEQRDEFLEYTNENGILTRPIWSLISHSEMYRDCLNDGLKNSIWLEERVVNIPSSVKI